MRVNCLVLLLVCIGAAAQERLPSKDVNGYSKEKEAALGAQLANEVRRETTLLENARVADYVQRLGSSLVSHLPGDAPHLLSTSS